MILLEAQEELNQEPVPEVLVRERDRGLQVEEE